MRAVAVVLAIAGCSYHPHIASDDAAGGDGLLPDGFAGEIDVAHLGPAEETKLTSTAAWVLDGTTTIDTGTGAIDPPPPDGVVIVMAAQDGNGPPVMVIQARTIEIGHDVDVTGARALIFVATEAFTLDDNTIDVSAKRAVPGPGGFAGGAGPGAGSVGVRNTVADGGSGGASYGTVPHGAAGGPGSLPAATGGPAGLPYGGPDVLQGGSGGGKSSNGDTACEGAGGAGGGALQITAPVIIGVQNALINAGGGGGAGGSSCAVDGPGGAGGGSGGMVFLDAAMLTGTIKLFALGAGGGEAGSGDGGSSGNSGADAGIVSGAGGFGSTGGGDGGRGAASAPAVQGGGPSEGGVTSNGGGGGGGAGRIYFRHALSNPFTSTPAAEPG